MTRFYSFLQSIAMAHQDEDKGATMVEYGLIVAAIAIVVVVGAKVFGSSLSSFFGSLAGAI